MSIFGSTIHRLDTVDSTNNYANHLIEHNLAENGTVVVADFQTQGKGQRDKQWLADQGMNLTCSFVFFPANLSAERVYLINCWVSYCLIQLLKKFGISSTVKWPNDIMVENHKIAGILTEGVIQGEMVKVVTIGVGLNVNQAHFGHLQATSMRRETGTLYSLEEMLLLLCNLLNEVPLESLQEIQWREKYKEAMYGLGETHAFVCNHQRLQGIIEGISSTGQLEILVEGKRQTYSQGQINLEIPTVF
ncbi:MAG: biotin--[acetyl-CoA-carboxylase] ligase [Bacteroidetes bacterium]|nr:biotin--[acetyl-CoA-carboxylase] ligase [Bacteroidota bacterium]MBM3424200.1 biotin--[acetyl-CoA-carboxylase] ligase [Bacteroidota bacterium]